jgi:NADH-quinone oxidoreductase subunit E
MSEEINITTNTRSFSPATMEEVNRIIKMFPEGKHKSALLRILHLAQDEFGGWLSPETMDYVASILNLKSIEVYEVATFYSMYNLNPVGKVLFEVCRTGPCAIVGAEKIVKHIEDKLNIKTGETTKDGMFTLKQVECLGACGYAPMMQCGAIFHEHLTPQKVDELIEEYRRKNNN